MSPRALRGSILFILVLTSSLYITAAKTEAVEIINLVQWSVAEGGNDHWYALLPFQLFWEEADTVANNSFHLNKRGYLATVNSQSENDFIINNIIVDKHFDRVKNQYWLGGRYDDGEWTWITGEDFSFLNWAPGEPNNTGVETALGMWGLDNEGISPYPDDGMWNNSLPNDDIHDLHRYWAIIEWDPADSIAPRNYTRWAVEDGGNNHWYAIIPSELYWDDADTIARSLYHSDQQGYLATVTSPSENDFILEKVLAGTDQPSIEDMFWIGGKLEDNQWTWITGEDLSFQNWSTGEPNNYPVGIAMGMWGPNNINDPRRIPGKWNDALPNDSVHALHRYWAVVEWGYPDAPYEGIPIQWRVEDGGNGHWYSAFQTEMYWDDARDFVNSFIHQGMHGYLATSTSAGENEFITQNVLKEVRGGYQYHNQYWLGGIEIDDEWVWVTGEPFVYTNWNQGEPNNVGKETVLSIWGWETTSLDPPPDSGTWNNSLAKSPENHLHIYNSIIEWNDPNSGSVVIPTNEWINVYCDQPTLDGEYLQPGTIIDAYDPDKVLCGRGMVNSDGKFGFIPIYRDDIFSDFDEGAEPGDLISFKIDGQPVSTSPEVTWDVNGSSFNLCLFTSATCYEINLKEGWNLISWNKEFTTDVESLIGDFKDKVDRILGFENGGMTYVPGLEKFSSLNELDYFSGYWFKMKAPVTLEICGPEIPETYSIPISLGWNLVAYWPEDIIPIEDALTSVLNNVTVALAFDEGAKTWLARQGTLNTLTDMAPGLGYWLFSFGDDVLAYPGFGFGEDPTSKAAPQKTLAAAPSEEISRVWISVYGESIKLDGASLSDGSRIEFATSGGVNCGRGIYSDGVLKFTPVYGREADNNNSYDLPITGDELKIMVNGTTVKQTISFAKHGQLTRINNLTSKQSANSLPDKFALHQNYPNPFNPATEISFALPEASEIQLTIYNVLGQEIATIASGKYIAGFHRIEWSGIDYSGRKVSSGVYFYRLTTEHFVDQKKMVLIK